MTPDGARLIIRVGGFRFGPGGEKIGTMEPQHQPAAQWPAVPTGMLLTAADVVVGAVVATAAVAAAAAAVLERRLRPTLGLIAPVLLRPPLVPTRLQPGYWLEMSRRVGWERRRSFVREAPALLDVVVPVVVEEIVRRLDLTSLITRHVDLDRIVSGVDLDAVAQRLDIDAVAARIDLGAIVNRLDIDAIAAGIDLDAIVNRLDLDAVARGLDVEAIVDRLDLTKIVLTRLDLEAVVSAALDTVDLPGIAVEVIDAIDLPEIIRESTGSMASDTVRGARMQGIAADETVSRVVGRLLSRGGRRGGGSNQAGGAAGPGETDETPSPSPDAAVTSP